MASSTGQNALTPPTPKTPRPATSVSAMLRICIKRKDNTYVPCIPVDQFPDWFEIDGVPKTLPGEDVLRLGLMNCGDHPKTNNDTYQVRLSDIPAHVHACNSRRNSEADDSSSSMVSSMTAERILIAPDKNMGASDANLDNTGKGKANVEYNQAKTAEIPFNPGVPLEIPFIPGAPVICQGPPITFKKKEYCCFYLRNGDCSYVQQGCQYSHVFPRDPAVWRGLGFTHYPTWPRDNPSVTYKVVGEFQPNKMQEASWRRGRTQNKSEELTEAQKHGHGRTSSNIAAPVPFLGQVQTSALVHVPTITAANSCGQGSVLSVQNLQNVQAAQQSGLFLPPQQQFFPPAANTLAHNIPRVQISFNGSNGDMSPQVTIPRARESVRSRNSTNGLFGDSIELGDNEHRPATLPPIGRPVFSAQPLNTSYGSKDPTKTTLYTPDQSTPNTMPQAGSSVAPSNSNTTAASAFKANQKAFGANRSARPSSRGWTSANSSVNTTATSTGIDLSAESTTSPPVLHHRLFVGDGESSWAANPVGAGSSKSRQRSKKRGDGKSRYVGKAGPLSKDQAKGEKPQPLLV